MDVSGTTVQVSGISAIKTVSLEEILSDEKHLNDLRKRWNWNQRMVLAFRLASSLLQYHSTPWLNRLWTKKDICFLRSDSLIPGGSFLFEADHPFINHVFTNSPKSASSHPHSAKQSVLDLGIILLEIWHVMAFETYIAAENLTVDESYGSRYDAATKWLNDTADNILPFYLDAACRCIEGTLSCNAPMLDWDDVQFRKSVCEGVVRPLWENCARRAR